MWGDVGIFNVQKISPLILVAGQELAAYEYFWTLETVQLPEALKGLPIMEGVPGEPPSLERGWEKTFTYR